ncbi:BMP-binding endothelial regulator protein-like [Saccoglossus kowalevskii]|uniref:Kielin/chordin-like protein-like n=1 Tax=Saccoglossus kowalevskii TaxID=10224 RepID=A0ABM0MKI9_SACKO|nr:PREDICTED: kielin/chordin-like protein-like [Saccoglossus kowalevskii]
MYRFVLVYTLVAATASHVMSMKLGQPNHHSIGVRAGGWGDPEFDTIDGRMYVFSGNCSYVLLRECHDPLGPPRFSVNIVNARTLNTPYTAAVYIDTVYVLIDLEGGSVFRVDLLQGKYLSINNQTSIHIVDIVDKWEDVENGITIRQFNYKILVTKRDEFSVCWDGKGRVDVKVNDNFNGEVCGLLGNANDNPDDDLQELTSEGLQLVENVNDFAMSWQIKDSCRIE